MVELWLSWGFEKSTGVKLFTSQDLNVICLEYWSDQLRSKITSLIFNPITYGRRGASKMIIYCSLIYVCIDLKLLDYTKISTSTIPSRSCEAPVRVCVLGLLILFYLILLYLIFFILFYFILFYLILYYSISFLFILFHFILFYFIF